MVSLCTLLKDLLSVKHCVIETHDLVTDDNGATSFNFGSY